jgi:tripeptidyl-peptidase-2
MVQVAKAFDHLVATKDFPSEDIHFQVSFEGRPAPSRGIYLRQPQESTRRLTFTINVKPIFRNTDQLDETAQSERINFEMKFAVTSTAPTWLFTPDHFMLMNNGRNFRVAVDGTSLSPGLHTAKVVAYDADHRERGAIFSLPVTIVKPLPEERQIDLPQLSVRADF